MGDSLAWVTLATNDSYSLGALVLAHSLKQVGTKQQLAVLITPGVTGAMRSKLQEVFNLVQEVNLLDSRDEANLRLLKRPELGITFTKLHCWRLTQFNKCVFLDADTLVLDNCDELFEREELSAAPDIGWPDCFNSGVFVYQPSNETYEKLIQLALEKGSFDGGDQGLLNLYFSDWAHKDISKHLPFIYNMASTACYSYLPAFKQFGQNAKIIHFIGSAKPWLQYFDTETKQVHPAQDMQHLKELLQRWWNIFCSCIHPNLSSEMAGIAGAFAKLTLGTPRTAEQLALDDHLRRQGWEIGNIDYLGRDSFENIWSKICETLSSGSESPKSVEKEPSPSKITPEKEPAKEVETDPVIQKEASVLDSTTPQEIEPTQPEVQPTESKKIIPTEIVGKLIETSAAEADSQTVKPQIDDPQSKATNVESIKPSEVPQSVELTQSSNLVLLSESSIKPTPEKQKSVSESPKLKPTNENAQVLVSPSPESPKTEADTVTLQPQAKTESPKSVIEIAPVAETVPVSSELIKSTPESISVSSESIPKVSESPKLTVETPEPLIGSAKPDTKAPQPEVESAKQTSESQIPASETPKAVTESPKQVAASAKPEAETPKPLVETPKPASESLSTVAETSKVPSPPTSSEIVAEGRKIETPPSEANKSAAESPKFEAPPPVLSKGAAKSPKVETPHPVSSKSAADSPKIEAPPPVLSKSAAESPKVEAPSPVSSKGAAESPIGEAPPLVLSKSAAESPKVETPPLLSNVSESPKPESKALPPQTVKPTAAGEQKGKKSKEVSKAEVIQPPTPTSPGSSQSKQTKQALGVEVSAPDTVPPAESSVGPTPPPRKGGSDKKKAGTKAKK